MAARRTKYPFHSKCGRKARLLPRKVLHPLAEKARQPSEQLTNGYFLQLFFPLFLFNQFWNHRYCSFKKTKQKKPTFSFHIKTNWGFCVVMTQITHITLCSQNHLGWELSWAPASTPALRLKRRIQSDSRIFEKHSAWTSAQSLRPKQSTVHWAPVLQPSVWKRAAAGQSVSHCV